MSNATLNIMERSGASLSSPAFTASELSLLEAGGQVIGYPPNTTLIAEGDDSDFVLYIRKGHVKIVKGDPPGITGIHGPGCVVGELASITGQPRGADVVTISQLEALYIPGDLWLNFLKDHPRAMLAQLRITGMQLSNQASKRVESMLGSEQRVAKALLELEASGLGTKNIDGLTFTNVSQHDLAALAGVSRESAVLVLRHLKSLSIVATGRQRITVRDLDAVLAIANRKHKAVS